MITGRNTSINDNDDDIDKSNICRIQTRNYNNKNYVTPLMMVKITMRITVTIFVAIMKMVMLMKMMLIAMVLLIMNLR